MANPQTERGFCRVANELLEAIIKAELTQREYKVLLFVMRQTYGFSRKFAHLGIRSIAEGAGLDRRNAQKVASGLRDRRILDVRETRSRNKPNLVGLNKDYESWDMPSRGVATDATDCPPCGVPTDATDPDLSRRQSDATARRQIDAATGAKVTPQDSEKRSTSPSTDQHLRHAPETSKETLKEREKESRIRSKHPGYYARALRGREDQIQTAEKELAEYLCSMTGFELSRALALVLQARDKHNPTGWLCQALSKREYQPSDTAWDQAKAMLREKRGRSDPAPIRNVLARLPGIKALDQAQPKG